ncbi:hypothetical protein HNQ94_000024 [Salirhabdus euzebyi]|uniref:Uncharacterized protein n=1 Tax=Salirhabdus euzebyi TaxID=394506 RepID=A0A841Q0Z3_9BACI|nr:hypothetical protein [Salirhabdus euzebyi]MBB6451603.1 hypothetical protein [Salirhabdus euzebyi]
MQNVLSKYKQQQADNLKQLQRLFQVEKTIIVKEAYDRMTSYREAITKEAEILHAYLIRLNYKYH